MTRALILVLAILTGGCTAIDFRCPRFDSAIDGFRRPLPYSPLEEAIRGQEEDPTQRAELERSRRSEGEAISRFAQSTPLAASPDSIPQYTELLLSGGGQWGAFGAGFMSRLLDRDAMPSPNLVTGVSTGALQALFVGAGLERPAAARRDWAERGVTPHSPPNYSDLMRYEYRPSREDQIVNRRKMIMAVPTGSMAGLRPLRRLIENSLCADPGGEGRCMIDDIAESAASEIWLGFVEAQNGNFYYVDAREIANDPLLSRGDKQQCIAAAALASVAMPAFFQQVRVNGRTYFDGGVRQSVFTDHAARHARRAIEAAYERAQSLQPPTPGGVPRSLSPEQIDQNLHVYVLRNGPTGLQTEGNADKITGVLGTALRTERIVVNQLEVGSIAALRIDHPIGPLLFRSADGWEGFPHEGQTCHARKNDGWMFDPDFMRCIMAFGDDVATTTAGPPDRAWRPLPDIPTLTRLDRAQ